MQYQFQIDNRPAAEVRRTWEAASLDAIKAGYAVRCGKDKIRLNEQASIARIND